MDNYMLFFFCLILTIGIIGFIGNLIVIIIYLYDKSLRSFTNFFFVNLSVVDILIILICLPVGLLDLINEGIWILGAHVCHLQHFVEGVLISVSSLTLISISLERYMAISRPFNIGRLINKKISILTILSLWILSMIVSAPLIRYTTFFTEEQNGTGAVIVEYCYIDRSSIYPKIYVSSFTAVFIFAPTIILSGVYIIIIKKLKQLNQCYFVHKSASGALNNNINNNNKKRISWPTTDTLRLKRNKNKNLYVPDTELYTNPNSYTMKVIYTPQSSKSVLANTQSSYIKSASKLDFNKNNSKQVKSEVGIKRKSMPGGRCTYGKNLIAKRNQTITICLISLAFFFCQIPIKVFQIFNAFYVFENSTQPADALFRFKIMNIIFLSTKLLYFLHGMSNPIIYNLMSTKFRKSFKNVILCKPLNINYSYVHKFFFKIPAYSIPNNNNNNSIINLNNNKQKNNNNIIISSKTMKNSNNNTPDNLAMVNGNIKKTLNNGSNSNRSGSSKNSRIMSKNSYYD